MEAKHRRAALFRSKGAALDMSFVGEGRRVGDMTARIWNRGFV